MAIENAKTLNVRIRNKYDSYENWIGSNLVLESGEIAIAYTTVDVKVDNGTAKHPALLMKVGDGQKTFANLPWLSAKAADVLSVCKNEADLTEFVNGVIADAGIASDEAMEALAGRVTTAEGEIDALQADLNTENTGLKARVATAEGAIDALELLVGDKSVNTQIQEYVNGLNLATTYAAKSVETTVADHIADTVAHVTTADKTKWNAALQASDIAAGSANGTVAVKGVDVAITGLGSAAFTESTAYDASGAAATAESNAKAYAKEYADGLAGNYDANGSAAAAEAAAKKYAKEYADGLAGNYDAAGSAAAAQAAAVKHTDDELARLVGTETVSAQIGTAITNANLGQYETKEDAGKKLTEAKSHADGLNTAMNTRVEALEAIDHDHGNKTVLDGITAEKVAAWDAAEQNAKDYADDLDEAMDERVQALEAKFGDGEGNVEAQIAAAVAAEAKLRDDADKELAADIKAITDDYLKAADKTALQDQITELDGLVGDKAVSEQITDVTDPLAARVKAVEDDYLKAADKTELEGKITTNANAIERLTNGVSAEEVDGVNDLIQYVKDHGTEVTGMKGDIKANADAIDAIEKDYLKAADKTELEGKITTAQNAADKAQGEVDALEEVVATKAAQSDLEALAGRVTTVEGDLNTETTGLKARLTQAESDIDALETKVGDETVAKQIEDAITALKIGDYAKAADLTAAINQHNTDKSALETEIAKKANDADLAAIAKTGSTDDLVQGEMVLLFDCGNASV